VGLKHARSVLCLPIVKQTTLVSVLYLENNLTPRAFTAGRVAVLELLASQAAISLENAGLYSDLEGSYSDLHRSETFLAEGQSISRTGSFGWSVFNGEIFWSEETYNIFEFDRAAKPTLELVLRRTHPDDRDIVQQTLDRASHAEIDFDLEHRLLLPDGSVKHVHVIARASNTSSGKVEYVGAITDITERKGTEEALRRSERYLEEAQRLAHMGSWVWRLTGKDAVHLSEEWYRIYGFDPGEGTPTWSERLQRIHPEDRFKWQEAIDRAISEKLDYEVEFRILLPKGTGKHIYTVGHPVLSASEDLTEFVGSSADITERKRASGRSLTSRLNTSPSLGLIAIALYVNQAALDYFDITLEEWRSGDRGRFLYPDDWERLMSETQIKFLRGLPHEAEVRLLRKDGKHRWFLFRWNPLRDE
jgi:PAS domain-containing protein